jgi:hypothetical protein
VLVPRRVGDDEAPPRRVEIAIGDVDRDALLALGGKTIEQQRVIEVVAARAETPRVLGERGELIVVDGAEVVEETSEQRALAVVDAAARDDAQQSALERAAGGPPGGRGRGRGSQK